MHLVLQQHLPHLHMLTHAHTRSHTSAGTHTYSPFLCITLLLLCPELTVQAQQNHWSYTQPAGSLEVPVSHTPTSSLLLAVLTPSFSSLSYTRRHTPSLPYTHTHTEFSPLLPYLLSWQREKLLLAGLFHSEAVAHQRRSRSGGWSCGGGGGRRHEMGTMNGPDSTLRRESGRRRWLRARVARRAPASDCDAAAAATITQIAMLP